MMPKSLLTLVALSIATTVFAQTWADPYASMRLPQAQPIMMPALTPVTAAAPMPNFNNELLLPTASQSSQQLHLTTEHQDNSMLPLRLAGYELRVMDVTKKVSFDVNGQSVRADVPIFIYMPREPRSMEDSTQELRKIYNDLILIYDKEQVDKAHVRDMLKRLDGVIDKFDALNASITQRTNAVK